jgi:peptidoglycan/xylan/chitin deacetylase (PgdA/CDA1 family)
MFLKRSLVLVVGVILFIAFFLLRFHLSDAHIENIFHEERQQFAVTDQVLTTPEVPASPVPPAPAPVAAPTAPDSSAAASSPDTTPAPTPAASPDASGSSSGPPAPATGNAPDPNMIIGPVPPSSATPDASPAPAPAPGGDTNGGPMAPPASTMVTPSPLGARVAFLALGAFHSGALPLRLADDEVTQAVAPAPQPATPAVPATNATAVKTAPVFAGTNEAPTAAVPIRPTAENKRAIVLGFHQFTGPGVPSKNIYSMSQDVFAGEMKYLHDNDYHVVPLSDVVRFVKHEGELPPNAVAITIDDGYKSALVYAEPVLKQYNYPWTYFVYPQFITRTEGKGAASWPDLVALDAQGVDVECHSMTHPILTKKTQKFNGKTHLLSDAEYDQFLTEETSGAKALLEKELGKTIKYFAYPYGAYNKQVQAKAIAAGFEAIFTVADNPVHVTTDVYSIGRYIITKPVERNFAAYLRQGALSLAQVDPEPGATTSNPLPVITAVLAFTGDPASIETDVRDFGSVRHDFDPQTSTIRLYLPRPLIQPEVLVSIRAKDAQTGQIMVANWHFNYEPTGATAPAHAPIPSGATTNSAAASPSAEPAAASPTNAMATPVKSATTTTP